MVIDTGTDKTENVYRHVMPATTPIRTVARVIAVGGVKYRVISVFTDKVGLGEALRNIAMKKQGYSRHTKAG